MLTKSALTYIGALIKSALPYAIVDGSPKNFFASLTSYRSLQEAIGAAAVTGQKSIKVKPGLYNENVVLSGDDFVIEGAGWSTIVNAASGTAWTISGDRNIVKNIAGTSPGTTKPLVITGDHNRVDRIYATNSFITVGGTGNIVTGLLCAPSGGGSNDFGIGGTNNIVELAYIGAGSANEVINMYGNGCGFFHSRVGAGGSRSLRLSGGATNCLMDGILHDQGGTLDSGTGNQTSALEEF